MLKKSTLFLLLLIVTITISSNELKSINEILAFLSSEDLEILSESGELIKFHDEEFIPNNIPNTELKSTIKKKYKNSNFNMGIEALFLHKTLITDTSQIDEILLKSYNIINSISTLEGIEYWSNSRKRMRLLFKESWLIDGVDTTNKIDDKQFSEIPLSGSILVHQKDSTFGSNISEISYNSAGDSVNMSINNLTDMWYAIIKVVKKNEMNINLLIVPTREGLLFYGVTGAKTMKIKKIQNKAVKSLYNRIVSFNTWFSDQFAKE